jgi:hypothetical protein
MKKANLSSLSHNDERMFVIFCQTMESAASYSQLGNPTNPESFLPYGCDVQLSMHPLN